MNIIKHYFVFLIIISSIFYSCNDDDSSVETGNSVNLERLYAGGGTTIFSVTNQAYATPAPNLSASELIKHLEGDYHFESVFVSAPAPFKSGLGPLYNNSSCVACHPLEGRARVPADPNTFSGFFFRISIPGVDAHNGALPVPGYGTQARNHAIPGFQPEMLFKVTWTEVQETLADGTIVSLRKPTYEITNPYYPMPSDVLISPRIGPPIFGLGLLESISEEDILANADEFDKNNDGISGRPNYVWNPKTQQTELGRFGWKANTPSNYIQIASAFYNDMGITSPLFNDDFPSDGLTDDPEISEEILEKTVFYSQTLAVPAPRNVDKKEVVNGYDIFNQINCSACHIEKFRTGNSAISTALSNQTIYPFTDMLLHDMGDDLADNRPDYLANGNEWKTRPLWGIGLQINVNGHTEFLHDGRARNLTEAILWHGGEAEESKNEFKALSTKDRNDLLEFLNSL